MALDSSEVSIVGGDLARALDEVASHSEARPVGVCFVGAAADHNPVEGDFSVAGGPRMRHKVDGIGAVDVAAVALSQLEQFVGKGWFPDGLGAGVLHEVLVLEGVAGVEVNDCIGKAAQNSKGAPRLFAKGGGLSLGWWGGVGLGGGARAAWAWGRLRKGQWWACTEASLPGCGRGALVATLGLGAGNTLRGAAGSTLKGAMGDSGCRAWLKILVSCWRVLISSAPALSWGVHGMGCFRAWMSCWAVHRVASLEDVEGSLQ